MGATAAIAAISAIGTVSNSMIQANAMKQQGKYESSIYETNARIADLQAQDAIKRGDKAAAENDRRTKVLLGAQRARMAAQGIDIESGSALDVQEDTAAYGAEDSLTIKNNAWREAWGYKAQANDYLSKSEFTRVTANSRAGQTIAAGGMQAAESISRAYYFSQSGGSSRGGNNDYAYGYRSDGSRIRISNPY